MTCSNICGVRLKQRVPSKRRDNRKSWFFYADSFEVKACYICLSDNSMNINLDYAETDNITSVELTS